jgi:hypothetical protein
VAVVPTASSTITVKVPLLVAVTAISAATALEADAICTALGFCSRMRGVKLLVWVISPTRMTMLSPMFAGKVQESESPTGEMVPEWVQPFVRAPWARALLVQSPVRKSSSKLVRAERQVTILLTVVIIENITFISRFEKKQLALFEKENRWRKRRCCADFDSTKKGEHDANLGLGFPTFVTYRFDRLQKSRCLSMEITSGAIL